MFDPAHRSDELRAILERAHRFGFLGPGPLEPHLRSAQGFAQALPMPCTKREVSLLDLGSGGGVPALPLLLWFDQLRGTLVDARSKRTRFLSDAVQRLELGERVQVVNARIEEVIDDHRDRDVVTARSFGPPSATLEIASGLLRVGGVALIAEPPSGRIWAAHGLERLGVVQRSAPGAAIAVFERVGAAPPERRWKHMVDRPVVEVTALS